MTYVVTWGRGNRRPVSDPVELDAVLDEIELAGRPQAVSIYPPVYLAEDFSPWDDQPRPPALQIGIGHPERAFVRWLGDGDIVGDEAGVSPWPAGVGDIAFDYGGDPVFCGPDRARVTPGTARRAAREFVASGGSRPAFLGWTTE